MEAVLTVRKIERAWIIDKDIDRASKLAKIFMNENNFKVTALSDSAVVKEADIICTATSSHRPVFLDKHIQAGTHINAVGAYKPDMQEIPESTIKHARLFVDSKSACLSEPGDILIPLNKGIIKEKHIVGEIGQLCTGSIRGRKYDDEVTLFKSVGNAVQDIFAAKTIYDKAIEKNVGTVLEL